MRLLIITLTLPFLLNAQVQYAGSIHPYDLYRISDGSEISLPFRLADMELIYTRNEIDFKLNSALEYRWSTGEYELDLREAYLVWYPNFGEVKLGKQIFAWGAADGNNPTDNLSAYDYYYLFLPGTDRKLGSLSAAVNLYFENWQMKAVIIPGHQDNRFPFGESDFPITTAIQPKDEQFVDIDNPLELGFRVQTIIMENDISFSYFNGHDRGFSPYEKVLIPVDTTGQMWVWAEIPSKFGYRATQVLGIDLVTFWNDFTFREELAYFMTKTEGDYNLPLSVNYIQYVFQVEYNSPFDITFMTQVIGNKELEINDESTPIDFNVTNPPSVLPDETRWDNETNFHAGMGTPFALFSDQSVILSAMGNLMDDRLELRGNVLMDLEETGYMLGMGADYSPIENWSIEFSVSKFIGDGDPNSDNVFNKLEDFSHIIIGLKYSF